MLTCTEYRWVVSQEAEEEIWKVREEAIRDLQSENGYEEAARKKFLDDEMSSAFRRMQLASEFGQLLQSQQSTDIPQQERSDSSDSSSVFESQGYGSDGNISSWPKQGSDKDLRRNDGNDSKFGAEAPEIEEAFPAEDDATLQLFRELAAHGRDSQALDGEQTPCNDTPVWLSSIESAARARLSNVPKEEQEPVHGVAGVFSSSTDATAIPGVECQEFLGQGETDLSELSRISNRVAKDAVCGE